MILLPIGDESRLTLFQGKLGDEMFKMYIFAVTLAVGWPVCQSVCLYVGWVKGWMKISRRYIRLKRVILIIVPVENRFDWNSFLLMIY